ncbi:uncharacterized protein BJ212DRAFT_1317989 [Suillus subaureus]|uniref:Uncharacterized protein n=1 Tax=Suillus subaureus TaxID=48587 RepID=A0A9P7EMF4_9AGAM|nr:uncharacterized protein BJ212DRAFT_1317989 [Suillus subaureus]KAG1826086.1 hypothetical protein BJ212DRAFT_1317989 [Suillus subaureus]
MMVTIFISNVILTFCWSDKFTTKSLICDSCKFVVGFFVVHRLTVLCSLAMCHIIYIVCGLSLTPLTGIPSRTCRSW